MDLRPLVESLRRLEDLPRLPAALGHEPLWEAWQVPLGRGRGGTASRVVGRTGDMPWIAAAAAPAGRTARALARTMAARGRLGVAIALEPSGGRLGVAVAFEEAPCVELDTRAPDPIALRRLERLAGFAEGRLAWIVRAAEALRGESAGRRFFLEFRRTLERMAAGLPGPLRADDRHAYALLQLTRVLFLYFVQAKGWLDGRERFLAEAVDRCLLARRRLHRDLLRPLFFGTLNRPAPERGRTARSFGAVPFLNGGLFEPHALERRVRGDVPNEIWRDAFDGLFERFHFTVVEGEDEAGIAPDMLGRVFEGVMAPDARRASGTYYTPAALVGDVLDAALAGLLADRLRCSEGRAARMLAERHPAAWPQLRTLTLLDPAAGSGAFLLGAMERLAALAPGGDSHETRRRILQRNLFGVDRNAGAVRLTALRLWLAVIAPDRTERPERVLPLPNLDCLVRQGDSLVEPITAGLRLPPAAISLTRELADARHRVIRTAGPEKGAALRTLAELEVRVASAALDHATADRAWAVAACVQAGRARDLFGRERGLDRPLAAALAEHRRVLHALRRARRALGREREVPWFHYQCHFADVFAAGGFDLIAGNPPWLRSEEIPADERRRLSGRYRWWTGASRGYANRPDLAVAFLERALELVRPGGVVAFLVPAKLATAGYAATARHELATRTTLLRVADLSGRPEAAFEATVYPLALVLRASPPATRHRVRTGLGALYRATIGQQSMRGGAPWVLTREPLRRAIAAVTAEHPRLDATLRCHLGLKTGANRVFLDPPENIESALLRLAIRGRDVRPFAVLPRRRLLFTHGGDGRPLTALPPRAGAYLARHAEVLRGRADYDGGAYWTLFRTGPATAAYRVVWSDLARRLTAAPLAGARHRMLIPLNTCYVAELPSASDAQRLASWLNCSWIRAAALAGAVPAAGGFARFTASAVGGLPLPPHVTTCARLPALAARAERGEAVQDELDEITAAHLALTAADRAILGRYLATRADYRG